MKKYLFFDNASTTKCCDEAVRLIRQYADEDFGNPSSSHALGQQAAKAIREARVYFSQVFQASPEQVIFTGSGSEADNLAVYGVAMDALARRARDPEQPAPRIVASRIEHPAVRKTVHSLAGLGIDVQFAPVDANGQVIASELESLVTPSTVLVSVMQVNNIMGAIQPVEELARRVKARNPKALFHTDAVQAFGRVPSPKGPSPVDLVSISAHKIEGPKGVGALIVLNRALLKSGLRPVIWGGEQEGGFRSGTQNAGLIAGFHAAARKTLEEAAAYAARAIELRARLEERLRALNLLTDDPKTSAIRWCSPRENVVPHIVSLSVPGYPSAPLARLLEERGCLVSTGSACSSQKIEPDAVLEAMGLPPQVHGSALRVSFSGHQEVAEADTLAAALDESIRLMKQLLGGGRPPAAKTGAKP